MENHLEHQESWNNAAGNKGQPAGIRSWASHGKQARVSVRSGSWMGLGASSIFAEAAGGFACDIRVQNSSGSADGKQILELLSLKVRPGAEVSIVAMGDRAGEAVEMLSGILEGEH